MNDWILKVKHGNASDFANYINIMLCFEQILSFELFSGFDSKGGSVGPFRRQDHYDRAGQYMSLLGFASH